jgi:plastocyanin
MQATCISFSGMAAPFIAVLLLIPGFASAQEVPVRAQVKIMRPVPARSEKSGPAADSSEVVIWLVPVDQAAPPAAEPGQKPQIVQKNKEFHPHLTVVRVGTVVNFPNRDPFFHNVFSLFNGKRFDLGLYEAGATNSVRFDHAGISFLFCNIHSEMSAVVISVDTPYYAASDKNGDVSIPAVPDGKYELHVWYERSLPAALNSLTRTVNVSIGARDLGPITVPVDSVFTTAHKNKYGQDYSPPRQRSYGVP